jgi:hypothetical protein
MDTSINMFNRVGTVTELVYQAVGAGSVCWENVEALRAAGTFDDVQARKIAEHFLARLAAMQETGLGPRILSLRQRAAEQEGSTVMEKIFIPVPQRGVGMTNQEILLDLGNVESVVPSAQIEDTCTVYMNSGTIWQIAWSKERFMQEMQVAAARAQGYSPEYDSADRSAAGDGTAAHGGWSTKLTFEAPGATDEVKADTKKLQGTYLGERSGNV